LIVGPGPLASRFHAQLFEIELGLKSPETAPVSTAAKDLGPAATTTKTTQSQSS